MSDGEITVIDVIRQLGVEPTPDLTWSVGARVRDLWEQQEGGEPPKQLRRKTAGGGTHCFAVYPHAWHGKIAGVVKAHQTEQARQPSLFPEDRP